MRNTRARISKGMRQDVGGIGQRASGPLWNESHSRELSVHNSLAADVECMKKVDVTPKVDCRRLCAFDLPTLAPLAARWMPTTSPRPVFDPSWLRLSANEMHGGEG